MSRKRGDLRPRRQPCHKTCPCWCHSTSAVDPHPREDCRTFVKRTHPQYVEPAVEKR
jgi:hypothetical protein